MHSAPLPVSSIYKEIPNTSKSNLETNLKIELKEGSQGEAGCPLIENENLSHQVAGIQPTEKEATALLTESWGEGHSERETAKIVED